MSKKILVLGHVDHGSTTITSRVVDALMAVGKEPTVVTIDELTEEKGIEIPKSESMIISAHPILKRIEKDGQTNRRERRKNKRK